MVEKHDADPGFGLKISPAAILRSLLQQYPSGGQFFLEALQNADDTGRATKCCAMLDLRRHPAKRLRAPIANRATLQNEAILFYDDAGFSERDWRSLQFMCDSQKRHTVHEAGAFGMGSRSFFHITDVLQVLSHSKLSALDPDELLASGHFGEQVDFVEDELLRKFPDEVAPFQGVFGCDLTADFPGTIIRASLRNPERAKACSFCPHPFDLSRAERIFKEFEEALTNGEVILFLTCVRRVELWQWDHGAKEPTLLARTQLGVSSGHAMPLPMASPREVRTYLEQFKYAAQPFAELQLALLGPGASPPKILDIVDMETEFASTGVKTTSRRWLRFGAFSTDPETVKLGTSCFSVPMVTLALPISGEAAEGRVFTLLPLPLRTGLPVHLNACFRLHDNRRALWRLAQDLEGDHHVWASWNERVLADFVPRIYAEALVWLANARGVAADHGQCAWPRETDTERDFCPIHDPLVVALNEQAVLAAANGVLVRPADAVFFLSPTSALQACRKELLDLCIEGGFMAVDPSEHVVSFLHKRKALTQKPCEWVLKDVLIPAAPGLPPAKRTRLLLAFLEWVGSWQESDIVALGATLADIEWVPSEDGTARTISESFDPEQSPEALGVVQNRRAKISEVMTLAGVKSDVVWRVLRLCGVKKEITWEDAVYESGEVVRTKDIARAVRLFTHLNRHHSHMRGGRVNALRVLQEAAWVPAQGPAKSPGDQPTQLLSLQAIFPQAAHKVIWAVAPSLCVPAEPALKELKPARSLESEPGILVEQLCTLADSSATFAPILLHLRGVFAALAHARTVAEVIVPTGARLKGAKLACMFLTFLEWVGSWKEPDIKELGKQLNSVRWVPVENGSECTIGECFDPASSPEAFTVVQHRRAKISSLIEEAGLNAEGVWHVLHLCGMKKEITWEDAVEEAEAIVRDNDMGRAEQLLQHLDRRNSQLRGGRVAAIKRLQGLAWVPATAPSMKPEEQKAVQLLLLKDVFLPSARRVVWAVAPCLSIETDPTTLELRPGRKIEAEPAILVQQLAKLAECAATAAGKKLMPADAAVKHMVAVFPALPPARIISEVLLPATTSCDLEGAKMTSLLLVFLEWAGTWPDADLRDLGRKIAGLTCIPVADGSRRAIGESFDPANSPAVFSTVRERRAQIDPLIKELGIKADVIWRVLHLCDLKREITWEDAVEEAEAVVRDRDLARAGQLYAHVDRHHEQLTGKRSAALGRLQGLAWVPAAEPSKDHGAPKATRLLQLKSVFPPAARQLVWAVAPSLCAEAETRVHELRPGRSIEAEPAILVEQVRAVTNSVADTAGAFAAILEHLRAVFGALAPTRILAEVVLPAASGLKGAKLAAFLLCFLEWAGSWKEAEVSELGRKLSGIAWIPSEDGAMRTIAESFDPENSPEPFGIVRARRAKVAPTLAEAGVGAEAVWRVLRLCGIKQDITWEDAVVEAEAVVRDKDFARAGHLFVHLNKRHAKLTGNRAAALEKLQTLAWVPATKPATGSGASQAAQLLALKSMFPASERKLVWAVAASLCADEEPVLHELKPGRSIEKEPLILVEQVQSLATSSAVANGSLLEHLRAVFAALSPGRVLTEVILPATKTLKEGNLAVFLLTFLEWTSSWKDAEVKEVGRKLGEVKWVPTEDGVARTIGDSFDPAKSPEAFDVVRNARVQILASLQEVGLKPEAVWKVLLLCGLKREITWEDAVAEAGSVMKAKDFGRAGKLFEHLHRQHAQLVGKRGAALEQLQGLAWVPASAPSADPKAAEATQLLALKDLFPPSARKLVWAVAPSLVAAADPSLHELRPGRSIEGAPAVLVEQVCKLAGLGASLEHFRAVFGALPPPRILAEVVLPASSKLSEPKLPAFLVGFLEWAGSWKEAEIKDLGVKLSTVRWVPVEGGNSRSMAETFDPEESPEAFSIVQERRAKIEHLVKDVGVRAEVVWRVLRLCGMKREITWEDAVEEAEAVIRDGDRARAGKLFAHVDRYHAKFTGARAAALEKLRELAWVPARAQSDHLEGEVTAKLASIKELFPASQHKLVWTVAASLDADMEPSLHELRPGRSIEKEPGILVDQVRELAEKPTSAANLQHLHLAFGALTPARVLKEVILPATTSLSKAKLASLLLALLEWAGSWKEAEIRELGRQLGGVQWVPGQDGKARAITECFDPEQSPEAFSLVRERRATVGPLIAEAGLRSDVVWRVLRLCGMKSELTWEDAVEEAEAVVRDKDFARATQLISHLDKSHGKLTGTRPAALERLQSLAWVPATSPAAQPGANKATQFMALKDVFPPEDHKLIWAVAPSLCMETSPTLQELKPGRKIQTETTVLVEQVQSLTNCKPKAAGGPPRKFSADVEHLRAVFGAIPPPKVLAEVILPVVSGLPEAGAASLLLAFLEWAGSLKETEVRELGNQLAGVKWVPTTAGAAREIRASFDPEESPEAFNLVRERRATIGPLISEAGLRSDVVWRVLRLCGIKREISWEDALEEAEAVVKDKDFQRAGQLFAHVDKNHAQLIGTRAAALEKLKSLAWVPASAATKDPAEVGANHFAALKDLFPPSARKLVWAVAPSLCVDMSPTLHELMPGRVVKEEPDILVEQVRALVDVAAASGDDPPCVSFETLEHLRDVFQELVTLLPKLSSPTLVDHPRLKGVAFMPCLPPDDDSGAALFPARRSAFHAKHNHRALSPAIGIVKPMDYQIKLLAEAAGVPREPRAEVLAEVLCAQVDSTASDLAMTLAIELAGRIRDKEDKPACIMVPTSTGTVERVEQVYIDDAPWQQGNIARLHPRISADDGRLLGCTSVRAELIRQCEDDGGAALGTGGLADGGAAAERQPAAAPDGDAFGQEADLVSQVMQLLQEYGDSADLVKEFVQNADDAGAESLAFFIQNQTFGSERIVDARTAALQGPALYVCCDNALTNEDIARMQNVGRSKKRLDFSSSGRFGVGMNVMYRYCDCPQLLANSRLHYFDLTRSFVAQPGMSRGRKFTTDKLKGHFPDSYAPFESGFAGRFPTVFRLALRTERSELGLKQDLEKVAEELKKASAIAEKMLLFTRNLTRLEFYHDDELISVHEAKIQKQDEFNAFFAEVPASPLDLTPGKMLSHRTAKTITMTSPEGTSTSEWAIAHRIGITEEKMRDILKEQLERPFGVALYPHGATAVRIKPFDEEQRCGRICVGLPTPFSTNSAAWIHGGFALLSSRKSLPLPEDNEREPSLDKSWNKMLLEGVIAESVHQLITYCCSQVIFSGMKLDEYYSVFPVRGDRLQTILARATWKAALKSAVFPVFRGSTGKVTWAQGPKPNFACEELPGDLQKALVEDGLKLASLPDDLMLEYEEALGEPRARLGGIELCQFLREAWGTLHAGEVEAGQVTGDGAKAVAETEAKVVEFELGAAGMQSLVKREDVVKMLAFASKGFWADHLEKNKKGGWHLHKFNLQEYLDQVPLLVTHAKQITAFSANNTKFNSWRDILPSKPSLFIEKECHRAIVDAVDTTAEGINREVKIDIPGVRAFTLTDLLPFRSEVEASINPKVNFSNSENQVLRQFWSLVADSALTESAATDIAEKHGVKLESATAAGGNQKWNKLVEEWPVLPVCFCDGDGENGEGCVPIHAAGSVVAVSLVAQDPDVVQSLMGILKQCGVATLQPEMLADERIARVVAPLVVTTNKGMLQLLCDDRSDVEALSGMQRHELLAYFSVLSVKGGIELDQVAKLPLFKTADPKQSTFVSLKKDITHCCVDPTDKHSNALCKLTPPRMVLLAWPTAQGKPIYEYCGVKLCSGEEFMVTYIIPELPGICSQDADGAASAPYLAELHAYACIDASDRVKKAASECDFVPSEDLSATGTPSVYVSTAVGAAKAFAGVLHAYLPAKWMQQNVQHMELLSTLGMSSALSPTMILLCAKHLHQAFTGDAKPSKGAPTEAGPKGQKRKADDTEALEIADAMALEEELRGGPSEILLSGCAGQQVLNGLYERTEDFRDYLGHDRQTFKRQAKGKTYFVYFWDDPEEKDSTGWYIASEVGSEEIFATNKAHNDAVSPPGPGDWQVQEEDPAGDKQPEPACGFGRAPKVAKPAPKAQKTGEAKALASDAMDEDAKPAEQVAAKLCKVLPALAGVYTRTMEHQEYLAHDRPTYHKKGYYLYFWNDKEDPDSMGWYVATEVGSEEVFALNKKHQDTTTPPGPGDWEIQGDDPAEGRQVDPGFGFESSPPAKVTAAEAAPEPNPFALATPESIKTTPLVASKDGEPPKLGPTGVVTDSLRVMSFELVEEFARAAEEVWPKPGAVRSALNDSSAKSNLHDMWSLLETASLCILVARRHASAETRKLELQGRNERQLQEKPEKADKQDKKDKRKEPEPGQLEASELELVPLKGAAFKFARQVLWSVCPVADHQPGPGSKPTTYLNSLVTNHSEGMYNVFGSFVKAKHAPPELVMQHLSCLCSLPELEAGLVAVRPGSVLHDDLKGCWAYFSDSLYSLESPEVKEALAQLRKLPCVAVHSEDVADRPVEETLLTLPKYAFFQLPLLRGKEANLRLYLRQVATDGPREAAVFRAFGAAERPGAADYAMASQRVAARAGKLGRAGWEWIVACLEACVRGFHEDVLHRRTEGVEVKVENLHMFTKDGKVEVTTQLVWADVPRWLNRCNETGGALKICSLKGDDQREIAKTLVDCAGLRELSALVEERRIMDDAGEQAGAVALEGEAAQEDEVSRKFKKSIQHLLQSFEFANGLCAVIRHTQTQNNQTCNTPAEVRQELRKIQFRISLRCLRSALFWKPKENTRHPHALVRGEPGPGWLCNGCRKDSDSNPKMVRFRCKESCDFDLCVECYSQTQRAIPGSEQDQQIYFDEAERCVYIRGKEKTGSAKEIEDLSSEMVFSLRRALPLLYQVDSFLLEALLGCGLRDGAEGIQGFLEKRDIKVVGLAAHEDHLGPGKALPPDLEKKLAWSMDSTFGEGETAAVLINDTFTIVEVASWPMGKEPPAGSGLSRSYRLRISGAMDESAYHSKKHFEIYKIPLDGEAEAAPQESMELEVLGAARDVVDEEPGAGGGTEEDDKKTADFKKYLHEMSDMAPEEYKAVMRRLFKTWHPDRAGDTPLSNRIFRMLRSHEQWYKKKQAGEDCGDWNDEEGEKGTVVVAEGEMKALPAPERHYVPAEGGQSSWFDEFESEMRLKKPGTVPSSKVMARPPEKPEYGPTEEPDGYDEDGKLEDGHVPIEVAPPPHMQKEESALVGPGRIVDRQQSPIWLQQARLEMVAARKLLEAFDGYRSLPAAAVWHSEQVVEMAIKAAMYRTCGVSEDEAIGGSAHDIAEFVRRLRGADAQTEEQRKAQMVPVDEQDVAWLKKAYLASRYPRPGDYRVPSENYAKADAERAVKLAEATLAWAADVEDLPDPGINKNTQQDEAQTMLDIRKRRWADMVGGSATATDAEKSKLQQAAPERGSKMPKVAAAGKFVSPPAKAGGAVAPPGKAGAVPPPGKAGSAPEAKAPPPKGHGGASPVGPPKAFGGPRAPAMPPPTSVTAPSAAAAPAAEAVGAPAAPGNRWKRHTAATAAPEGGGAEEEGGGEEGGEKRGGYEGRVADLKERLKMRKQGKARAP